MGPKAFSAGLGEALIDSPALPLTAARYRKSFTQGGHLSSSLGRPLHSGCKASLEHSCGARQRSVGH